MSLLCLFSACICDSEAERCARRSVESAGARADLSTSDFRSSSRSKNSPTFTTYLSQHRARPTESERACWERASDHTVVATDRCSTSYTHTSKMSEMLDSETASTRGRAPPPLRTARLGGTAPAASRSPALQGAPREARRHGRHETFTEKKSLMHQAIRA